MDLLARVGTECYRRLPDLRIGDFEPFRRSLEEATGVRCSESLVPFRSLRL